MRVTLNLASHPYVELRPLYQRLRANTIESAITQAHNERQQAEASMRQPKNAAVLAQSQFLNNLFLHKSFSWTAVMMDLEQVLPPNVQVLNIDPVVAKDGSVTIHMRVAGPRDKAVTLVRNLEHSHRFLTPRIVGETAQSQNQNGRPSANFEPVSETSGVNFDVLAEYNPLQPREAKQGAPAEKKDTTNVAAAGKIHHAARAHKPAPGQKAP
jgi:type IV pilus assembly protein PilN